MINRTFSLTIFLCLWVMTSSFITPTRAADDEREGPKTTIFARYNNDFRINLSQIFIPVTFSIEVLNPRTGEKMMLNASDDYQIKVVGKAGDMYEVKTIKNGELQPEVFLTHPSNIKKGVNWSAVKTIINSMDEAERAGILELICDPNKTIRPDSEQGPTYDEPGEDFSGVIPDTYVPPSDGEFHEGCEVLAEQPISPEGSDSLLKCVKSIQTAIAEGSRDSSGYLDHNKTFQALFERLNPEEQAFAGYIFTGMGESDMWVNKEHPEEAMFVMKVLQNRKRMAIEQGAKEPYNVLDVALDPWQFSTFNKGTPKCSYSKWVSTNGSGRGCQGFDWRNSMDPALNMDYSGIVEAYRRMTNPDESKWEPEDQMDNVSHYRRNYLSEPWPSSKGTRVQVHPKVNGTALRSSSSTQNGPEGPKGYNYIYSNLDGPKHWIYTESTRGNWRK